MSKKRTSAEHSNDEEGSESQLQKEGNAAKCAKLDLLSDTTLEDLPIELFECILVKVVTMEVWDLKLAKGVWKEKADVVLSRLSAVCPHWSSILMSALFRNELHRVLGGTAQEIRLQISTKSPYPSGDIRVMALLKDDRFYLYRRNNRDCINNLSKCNNVTETIRDIVPLQDADMMCMVACEVSNCVYVLLRNKNGRDPSVLRISKDEHHQFYMTLKYHKLPVSTMSVSANGNLIILSVQEGQGHSGHGVVSIYDANGSLQKEIILSPDIDAHRYKNAIQKLNGNLVLAYVNDETSKMKLLEIDLSGSVVREYQSSFSKESVVSFADIYDRIMIAEPLQGFELLDSEFNLLGVYIMKQDKGQDLFLTDLHYDRKLNHIVCIRFDRNAQAGSLTFFRFKEK